MGSRNFFISVAGNIGSGKTTFTEKFARESGWEAHFESVGDNPYLSDFYGDMKRWSLALQVFFLAKRFEAHLAIQHGSRHAIQDRSIYEDAHIFARALAETGDMDGRDFENYRSLFATMIRKLEPPDLVLYLRSSVPRVTERIRGRGRVFEQDIPTRYLELLHRCYEDWIDRYDLSKVLVVEVDELELKDNPEHFAALRAKIEDCLAQPSGRFRFTRPH
jgi:deoxyadenosine/deoxycytidine kinase